MQSSEASGARCQVAGFWCRAGSGLWLGFSVRVRDVHSQTTHAFGSL